MENKKSKHYRFWMGLLCPLFFVRAAMAVDFLLVSDVLHLDHDIQISEKSLVAADRIDIDGSIHVVNAGQISGDIHICSGCQVVVRNTGQIQGNVLMDPGASVVQMVDTADSLTSLPVSVGLSLRVVGDRGLSLNDILVHGMDTDEIILDNATVTWDRQRGRGIMPPIDLVGEVTVHIDPASAHDGDLILGNARGDGAVFVEVPDLDDLFTATAHRTGDNIYLQIRRETDYVKILDPRRGALMNALRLYDADDKLVRAMDGAQTRDEINAIMRQSVRLHPMRLMDGVHLFQAFNLMEVGETDSDFGNRSDQIVIFNDALWLSALRSHVFYGSRTFGISLGGTVGMLGHTDDLNDFTGVLYGMDMRVHGATQYVWTQMTAGLTWADFDVGPVLGKVGVDENPRGRSLYGAWDIGTSIQATDVIDVLPFVGVSARRTVLLADTDTDVVPRVGTRASATWGMDGMAYQMVMHAVTDASQATTLGLDLNIRSVMDGVSVGGGVAMHRDRDVMSFQGRLNLRYIF